MHNKIISNHREIAKTANSCFVSPVLYRELSGELFAPILLHYKSKFAAAYVD